MNYLEWSYEYTDTANSLLDVIKKLKSQRQSADELSKRDLDIKIAKYKSYYNECISIANHLYARYQGVE